ncbi:DNA replication and repair protein RecF [Caulobacter ginsengisoli]|uniref:DNA replication and repair protein RecF n=1 Tax=Caulobacter ginsengisoli TaxID=400775 RepID=A0ABU0IUK4_9CAUL|nr:DNA replication/repair protein RecF [Caulobacter ginsengisoli]MDQ0465696.1 DNA replication and repair protein RecF [Caulobacter ginsengisoli]
MTRSALAQLTLTDFRSYPAATLAPEGQSVFLFGPNGAGKTNLLEAISLFSPGRGLRGSALAEVGRRMPGEAGGRAWAVSAIVETDEDPIQLGTGVETPGAARRLVRIEGETVPPGRLADHIRPMWLTPAQDRLFLEAASERRRFFDRLVFAGEPAHAAHVAAYEKAMRERMRLLTDEDGEPDPVWLSALEARLAESGALMAEARARTLLALQEEIDGRGERPFPQARLSLAGEWEKLALSGVDFADIEARLATALTAARPRDAAAGRALTGPHRGDLGVVHAEKDRPAAECSTGEQKALILNLVLAQGARLSRAKTAPNPVLLLDEVAAHLDLHRRAALADEIAALGLQAFLTGTDESLFDHLKGRALGVRVDSSGLTTLEV